MLLLLYTLSKCMVSFHFALTVAEILVESYISLTLSVGCSTEHFLIEYGIFFSLYVFHMKLGSSLFLDLYISMARNSKCL